MQKAKWIVLFMVVVALLGISAAQIAFAAPPAQTGSINNAYPLAKGATWKYQAQVKYDANGKTLEKSLPWTVTVQDVIERGAVRVYVMNGQLGDLAFYQDGKKPGDSLLVEIVPNRFYTADIEDLKKFQDPDEILAGIVSDEDVVLDFPLVTGKRFCAADYITRSDGEYCWIAGDETIANLQAKGVPANALVAYPLTYQTNADHTTIQFVPGLGIAEYHYMHSGTPSQVDAKLTEYIAGAGTAATFTDPFAYCAAAGNADEPDAKWGGAKMPDAVLKGLVQAAGIAPDMPQEVLMQGSFWRCMNNKVYACTVGANLPCQEKADLSKTPGAALNEFCAKDPNADSIPAAVTGRATVYEWKCVNGKAEAGKQLFKADARGFISDFWYEISK